MLEHLRVGNEHVYLYRFDYYNPKSLDILGVTVPFKGATHCTELAYLFHVGIIKNFKFNAEDEKMLQLMTKMWANFAKYGYVFRRLPQKRSQDYGSSFVVDFKMPSMYSGKWKNFSGILMGQRKCPSHSCLLSGCLSPPSIQHVFYLSNLSPK